MALTQIFFNMRKLIIVLLFIVGCKDGNDFSNKNLKNISVFRFVNTVNEHKVITNISIYTACIITNYDSINHILNILNSKKEEPTVYMPEYKIELVYKDTLVDLYVKNKSIKMNGKTFKVNKNLSEYFSFCR